MNGSGGGGLTLRQQAIKGIKIATNRFWIRECLHVFLGVGVKCASARVSLDWKVIVPKPQHSKQFLTIQGVWIVKFHLSSVEFRRFKPFIISRGIGKHSSHNTSLNDCNIPRRHNKFTCPGNLLCQNHLQNSGVASRRTEPSAENLSNADEPKNLFNRCSQHIHPRFVVPKIREIGRSSTTGVCDEGPGFPSIDSSS
jgi:hypothetical protein